jgi:hypothetical protein
MSHCFRLLSIVLTASTAGLVSFIENRVQFVVPGQIHSRTCSKRSFHTMCKTHDEQLFRIPEDYIDGGFKDFRQRNNIA